MMQQDYCSTPWVNERRAEPLSVLAYRSVAVTPPTDADIKELLRAAQSRNRIENLSGVLVYDQGAFFQWLEGPTEALSRVWNSISHDPRHRQIRVLRDEPVSDRVFAGWDLRVAIGARGGVDAAIAAMDSSSASLRRALGRPSSLLGLTLEEVFRSTIIPRLSEVHGRDTGGHPLPSTATIWHADADTGAKLTSVLLAPRSAGVHRYVDSLLDQGANFDALCQEVFEPAQLSLGKLWENDDCNDFQLTIGLARLQLALRRVNAAIPAMHLSRPQHSILLCSQPSETDCLGLIMSSAVFDRKGWEVNCEFPQDDQNLNQLVHANWFDVLKLSQSGSKRRDDRLRSMRATIESARLASLNPSLLIMVDGRTFVERPQVYRAVQANASSASVLNAVLVAERLLVASRSQTALCQVSVC